jgi:hypothetical protein
MAFYEWSQNNSGGTFYTDDKICHQIFIEADNYDEAEQKALDFGVYYNGVDDGYDCSCCGDRWVSGKEINLEKPWIKEDNIEDYAQYLANNYGWTKPDIRIFYKSGEVKEVFTQR